MHLVLLPGLDGTGILFQPLVESLPAGIEPVVIPFPPTEPLDYPDLARFVAPRLPQSAPFVLLGESYAGPLALQLAAEGAPGIVGVVLCASFVSNPTLVPSSFRHLAGPWLYRFTPAFIQAKALLGGYSSPELRQLLLSAHGIVSARVMTQRIRSILSVDATPALTGDPAAPVLPAGSPRPRRPRPQLAPHSGDTPGRAGPPHSRPAPCPSTPAEGLGRCRVLLHRQPRRRLRSR